MLHICSERRMEMEERKPIILQVDKNMKEEELKELHKELVRQYKTGVIVLPKFVKLVKYPYSCDGGSDSK